MKNKKPLKKLEMHKMIKTNHKFKNYQKLKNQMQEPPLKPN